MDGYALTERNPLLKNHLSVHDRKGVCGEHEECVEQKIASLGHVRSPDEPVIVRECGFVCVWLRP